MKLSKKGNNESNKLSKKTNNESHLDVTYRQAITTGQIIGGIAFLGGITLCLLGLTGSVELILEGGGLKARLWNASPGVAIAFLGLWVVLWYKPKITHTTEVKESQTQKETKDGDKYVSTTSKTYENKSSGSRLAERK